MAGCASIESDWTRTQNEGTPVAFERFLQQYPSSKYSDDAKKIWWQMTLSSIQDMRVDLSQIHDFLEPKDLERVDALMQRRLRDHGYAPGVSSRVRIMPEINWSKVNYSEKDYTIPGYQFRVTRVHIFADFAVAIVPAESSFAAISCSSGKYRSVGVFPIENGKIEDEGQINLWIKQNLPAEIQTNSFEKALEACLSKLDEVLERPRTTTGERAKVEEVEKQLPEVTTRIAEPKLKLDKQKVLLTVDFQAGQILQYKFVSSREMELNWDPAGQASKPGSRTSSKSTESMEMVVAYTPVEVDPYGLTTIKATCKSAKVTRSKDATSRAGKPAPSAVEGNDAVEYVAGKTFTFTVGPTGKFEDYSQLNELIQQIGEKPFWQDARLGRMKAPDMIGDFILTQWFLWDSISSIEKPAAGVSAGQTWKSKLSIPTPMVMRKARDVTYQLSEIRQSEKGQLAVIQSSYSLAESVPSGWPIPYSGTFQMPGTFGFLRGYKVLDLKGEGEELFDIERGRIEQSTQQYQMQLEASLPLPLGTNPQITIRQKLTMQLM
jgi:hypothetical protein